MKKQINRMKQLGNQALGRSEKTEVLSDDLLECERKVDHIKHACHTTTKRLKECLMGSGSDVEKRQRKLPYYNLADSMHESSKNLGEQSVFGIMLGWGSEACSQIAAELTSHEMGLENLIMAPFTDILENEVPKVSASRKRLNKLILDYDSCRMRYLSHQEKGQGGKSPEFLSKLEAIRGEMDDANQRVEQCRDQLANEMMTLVSKEGELARSVIDMVQAQAQYHRSALARLEVLVPKMNEAMENLQRKPVYGTDLSEHLEMEGRKIATPLEIGAIWLMELGLDEEGLFRIAGSTSKVKILTNAYNARLELQVGDFLGHEHAVAGALKQYLRELPEPLLTYELYNEFRETQNISDEGKKLQALWTALYKLPKPDNFENFKYLVRFLHLVSKRSEKNKMSASNLALVIGPNIMWSEADEQGVSATSMGVASSVLESFITHADYFFPDELPFNPVSSIRRKKPPALVPNGDTKTTEPVTTSPIATVPSIVFKGSQPNLTATEAKPVPAESKPKRPTLNRKNTKRKAPVAPAKSPLPSPNPSPHNSLKRGSAPELTTFPIYIQGGASEELEQLAEKKEDESINTQEGSDSDEVVSHNDNGNSEGEQKEEEKPTGNPFDSDDNEEAVPSAQEEESKSQTPSKPEFPYEKPNRPTQQPPKPVRPEKPPVKDKPEKQGVREKPKPPKVSKPTKPPPMPKMPPKRDSSPENQVLSSPGKIENIPTSPSPILSPKIAGSIKFRPKIVPPPPPSEPVKTEEGHTQESKPDENEVPDFHKNETDHNTQL